MLPMAQNSFHREPTWQMLLQYINHAALPQANFSRLPFCVFPECHEKLLVWIGEIMWPVMIMWLGQRNITCIVCHLWNRENGKCLLRNRQHCRFHVSVIMLQWNHSLWSPRYYGHPAITVTSLLWSPRYYGHLAITLTLAQYQIFSPS